MANEEDKSSNQLPKNVILNNTLGCCSLAHTRTYPAPRIRLRTSLTIDKKLRTEGIEAVEITLQEAL
jgi:hypothetical protein